MKIRRFVAIGVGFLLLLVLGFWGLTAGLKMNNPVVLGKYLTTRTSELGTLFPYRTLEPSTNPQAIPQAITPLPETVVWNGKTVTTEEFLNGTSTNSFLVMCKGEQVHEWFREEDDADRPQSSWSVAKSFVGLVISQLIEEGKLSEDTTIVEVLPEFETGTNFDEVTVGDLLDMASGIDLNEDYSYFKPFWGVGGLQITTDLHAYLLKNRGMRFEPGARFDYRSIDTQYLSMIASTVEDDTMTAIMQRRIWEPLGMEDEARWNIDHEGGIEKGFAGINATPRDFAKMGLLMANGGKVGDKQVISKAWIDRIMNATLDAADGWGYSAQFWRPPGYEQEHDLSGIGVYGQFVYANPEKQTVVVKLSDDDVERDDVESTDVFRQFAESCAGGTR